MYTIAYYAPWLGVLGLVVIALISMSISKADDGNDKMRHIASLIKEGAMAYMSRQLINVGIFIACVVILLALFLKPYGIETAIAYAAGGIISILCGFIGMRAATKANVRTAAAANKFGMAKALAMAFNGGAVMGLAVASLGLIGFGLLYWFLMTKYGADGDYSKLAIMNGFGMGASSIALFMRVGGGIYTKSADVGADLVGKVEAGIPEDDPRNPAVIADNVGDNVGDVAGMGADLFESYVGSVVATMALGVLMANATFQWMILPLVLITVGAVSSFVGTLFLNLVRDKNPAAALNGSTYVAGGLFIAASYFVVKIGRAH